MPKDGIHTVDLFEVAFRLATISEAFKMAKSVILEPIMNVEVVAPAVRMLAPYSYLCPKLKINNKK